MPLYIRGNGSFSLSSFLSTPFPFGPVDAAAASPPLPRCRRRRSPLPTLPPAIAPSCFLNLNWDQSMNAAAADGHLDPPLSSMISFPASNSTAAASTEGLALHGISPQPHYSGTPLSSPSKLNLSMMSQFHHYPPPQVGGAGAGGLPILENLLPMGPLDQFLTDSGFERAARLSGFDSRGSSGGYGGAAPVQFGLPDVGPISALKELELGNARDESSVSDPASASAEMALKRPSEGNARKRKASGKGKGKDGPMSTSAKDLAMRVTLHGVSVWIDAPLELAVNDMLKSMGT